MYLSYLKKQLNELAKGSRLRRTLFYTQHGNTSCLLHMLAVAHYCSKLDDMLGLNCNKAELIRGALLHDYFLYDWHDGKPERRIHGFTHPKAALLNAECDFFLSERERDIIRKHMFPLTFNPPKYRESWIVCLIDKACSLYETFNKKNAYPHLRSYIEELSMAYAV